jgi:1-phosphatidylinositol phosphodiesterase
MVFQHKDFHSVIADCIAFLREHPTEAIVMRVKEEYTAVDNTRPFDESVRAAIRQIEELSAVQVAPASVHRTKRRRVIS